MFAREGLQWPTSRLYIQIFTDEIWAMGGAHTILYIIIKEDRSDRYLLENLQHKYLKAPAWMFFEFIVRGKKSLAIFWEKEWEKINSERYDCYILSKIQEFMDKNPG